jgi:hypothetical protein
LRTDAARNRERIVAAARQMFTERGLDVPVKPALTLLPDFVILPQWSRSSARSVTVGRMPPAAS